jgi:hypothetical protein
MPLVAEIAKFEGDHRAATHVPTCDGHPATGWPLFFCLVYSAAALFCAFRAGEGIISTMWHCGLALAVGMVLAGCEPPGAVSIVSSPYSDGVEHIEPVVYNGKSYDVSFRFSAAGNLYEVTVAGKGRKIGGTRRPADRRAGGHLCGAPFRLPHRPARSGGAGIGATRRQCLGDAGSLRLRALTGPVKRRSRGPGVERLGEEIDARAGP